MSAEDRNHQVYNDPSVVEFYAADTRLQDAEAYLFDRYAAQGDAILDIGVGGGRTTPALSAKASSYVGVDYAQAMVNVCRKRFPALEFLCADACDLRRFADASFDIAVFSFNGIDVIRTDERRAQAMREIARVLKPGGRFIFSSHNARMAGSWPAGPRRARPRQAASPRSIAEKLKLASIRRHALFTFRTLTSSAFYVGRGYLVDPVHGGLNLFVTTPKFMEQELGKCGLALVETVGNQYPRRTNPFLTRWYHYVACK